MHQKMIFTDDYLIGIPEIDKQHKHLFELIAEVDQSLEDKVDPKRIEGIDLADADEHQKEYLEDLLGFLLNWLSAHILNMDKRIPVK